MQHFSFEKTNFDGAWIVNPFVADDDRGSFVKDYSEEVFNKYGVTHPLKEVFYTYSYKGVIRAIHFQNTKEQAKLVRCVRGCVWDMIVDLRRESQTFGQWQAFELSGDNKKQLLVPEHFGHGYLVIQESIVSYKCSEKFYGEYDDGILWNDPDIDVDWPLERVGGMENVILSDKDRKLSSFRQFKDALL